jgi:hypothetical protein
MGKNRNQWVYTLLGYVVIAFCVGLVGALIVGGHIGFWSFKRSPSVFSVSGRAF